MPEYVLIRGGLRAIEELLEEYKRLIYRYNELLRGTGLYLKPMHVVTRETRLGRLRYIYIGRYWWRVSYAGKSGKTSRVKWVYLGREKPPEASSLPDPPEHPVAGLTYAIVNGGDVVLRREVYERYRWLFEGYEAVPLGVDEPSPHPRRRPVTRAGGGRR